MTRNPLDLETESFIFPARYIENVIFLTQDPDPIQMWQWLQLPVPGPGLNGQNKKDSRTKERDLQPPRPRQFLRLIQAAPRPRLATQFSALLSPDVILDLVSAILSDHLPDIILDLSMIWSPDVILDLIDYSKVNHLSLDPLVFTIFIHSKQKQVCVIESVCQTVWTNVVCFEWVKIICMSRSRLEQLTFK